MKLLALESSARAASCAVLEDGGVIASAWQATGLTHSRTLLPMVEDMLRADQAGAGGGNEVSSITRGDTSIHYRDKASAYQNAANFVRDYEKMIIPFRRMKYPKEHSYD